MRLSEFSVGKSATEPTKSAEVNFSPSVGPGTALIGAVAVLGAIVTAICYKLHMKRKKELEEVEH
ncbi:MAG: hypothetical protein QMD21_01165 [Candidatus Thermoplasmatota archaeon]|nr:hypothetical protein [Candidatus Thermoplasmatota archaeon]